MLHSRVNSEERETAALLSHLVNSFDVSRSTARRTAAREIQYRETREFLSFGEVR